MLFSEYKLPFLISLVFACTQSSLFAQDTNATLDTNTSVNQSTIKSGRILGRVFDADSGEALKNVTVILEDQNRETKTDLEGRYRLPDIAPGGLFTALFQRKLSAHSSKSRRGGFRSLQACRSSVKSRLLKP